MIFVDTNYFLRFLLKDNKNQHQEAKKLITDAAKGKIKLFTSIIVFFEIYWVLTSYYEKNKDELINTLHEILSLTFIELGERKMIGSALEIFSKSNISLEDSYNLVYSYENKAEGFKTFDVKLTRLFNK